MAQVISMKHSHHPTHLHKNILIGRQISASRKSKLSPNSIRILLRYQNTEATNWSIRNEYRSLWQTRIHKYTYKLSSL